MGTYSLRVALTVLALSLYLPSCEWPPNRQSDTAGAGGSDANVVEELRIGTDEGPEELMFGHVARLTTGDDGSVFVADEQALEIRAFDADGNYLRHFGRRGQGPGEYARIDGLRVLADGSLVVWDRENARVSFFDPSAQHLSSFQVENGLSGAETLEIDTDGNVYVLTRDDAGIDWRESVLVKYSRLGESLGRVKVPFAAPVPDPGFVVLHPSGTLRPFSLLTFYAWSPLGFLVVGRNDAYELRTSHPAEPMSTRLTRAVDRIRVGDEERAEWQAIARFVETRGRNLGFDVDLVSVPEFKPFFRNVAAGRSGRIWILRHVQARKTESSAPHFGAQDRPPLTWVEPPTFDVFEGDGSFLGTVELPLNVQALEFRGNHIWGVHTDEAGVERVVRFRVRGWN